ncbi:MAG TPA: proline--tRNA ligase [Candidatus Saccharimonadales bacterium]|nr:proline--tRNA ligase [Candidatus Saccharimonadales bacterium]
MSYSKRDLPKKSENLSDWYNKIVMQAELADYGPAKGTMIFRPYGYAIWELSQQAMDKEIKARGVDNAYFPIFIPESFLKKEKDHLEGFAPELAVVTIGGGEELKERLIVRPTSETIMYDAYSRWLQSWRDLPILINQWGNAVRWEKRTYLFLRTTEFLWQEGHTAHATHEESLDTVQWAMDMYTKIYKEVYALPGYVGKKSRSETFAGADMTLTYESLMPEGKALQACTSHDLGQNFSKAFNVSFQDKQGVNQFVWQTSWGFSTRAIGGLLMAHGDDAGLRIPPKLAPIQVIILPVRLEEEVIEFSKDLVQKLSDENIRVRFDNREEESIGFKHNKWELKGVPIRMEIGKREIAENKITIVRRDTNEKLQIDAKDVTSYVSTLLEEIQDSLYQQQISFLKENTRIANSYEEFKTIMETTKGFIKAFWCEDKVCEEKIKEETKASTRCLPVDTKDSKGTCIYCKKEATHQWLFAQAY